MVGRISAPPKRHPATKGPPSTEPVKQQLSPPAVPAQPDIDRARATVGARSSASAVNAPLGDGKTARTSAGGLNHAEVRAIGRIPQVTGWNFDWDDNIFFMPTRIHIFHRETGERADISTADWALIREQVGKEGKYASYTLQPSSLADFADDPTGRANHFLNDVVRAMETSSTAFKGPSWDAFVKACASESTAAATTIITARLHSPGTIHAGLVELHRRGILKFLPPKENIFPVSNPAVAAELGGGSAINPSAAKAVVMARVLDQIQAHGLHAGARRVLAPDGSEHRRMHLWGFSDDDYGNYAKAVAALSVEMKKDPGRWKDIKVTVIFTGTNHPTVKPHAVVLGPDGAARPYLRAELVEVSRLLGASVRAVLTRSAI